MLRTGTCLAAMLLVAGTSPYRFGPNRGTGTGRHCAGRRCARETFQNETDG